MDKKKKIIIGSTIAAILIVSIGISINRKNNNIVQVKTVKINKGEIRNYLSTSGIVQSENKREYFGSQGKIQNISVKVGDKVKKGQVLATFDMPDLENAREQAQLQYDNAVLQRDELRSQKNRMDSKSSNPGMMPISENKITAMDNQIKIAELALEQANDKINSNSDKIVSDIDGVVTEVNGSAGAMNTASQPLIIVQDTKKLKIQVPLGKYDANKVKTGMKAKVKSGDENYNGVVNLVEPTAKQTASKGGNETTLNCYVKVLDKNIEGLKIAFDADVDILLGESRNVLRVPLDCIKTDKNNRHFVYTIKENKIVEHRIELGMQSDTEAEVITGLKSGEKVVVNPKENVKSGTTVKEKVGDK